MSEFLGDVSGLLDRTSFKQITSIDHVEASVRHACYVKQGLPRAIGLEAFGAKAIGDPSAFAKAKPTGRIVQIESGTYATGNVINATKPTGRFVGRFERRNPAITAGLDETKYAWHEMVFDEIIPQNDIDDNGKGVIDERMLKEERIKMAASEAWNWAILGNSNAPNAGVRGPSAVYNDLTNLISVTQTRTVGNIAATNSFWQNGYKAIASIGGGGEMDRPMNLRRQLVAGLMERMQYGEATNDFLLLATPGAWLYYDRLMYADTIQGGKGVYGTSAKYDAAGITNFAVNGNPMITDPAVTVPYGATASTEAIYGIHIPDFFLSIRAEKNFKWSGWEKAREHDEFDGQVGRLVVRFTPGVKARRSHVVFYNLPANSDITVAS